MLTLMGAWGGKPTTWGGGGTLPPLSDLSPSQAIIQPPPTLWGWRGKTVPSQSHQATPSHPMGRQDSAKPSQAKRSHHPTRSHPPGDGEATQWLAWKPSQATKPPCHPLPPPGDGEATQCQAPARPTAPRQAAGGNAFLRARGSSAALFFPSFFWNMPGDWFFGTFENRTFPRNFFARPVFSCS
jgi:hypothetical protein